jgi:hypothetical protein
MTDTPSIGAELTVLNEAAPDTKIAPAHGIAAIALSMAMKYHDISTVQDGTLYQQYKLEGRNMRELDIDMVFVTAIKIELHLLASSDRIAAVLVDALRATDPDEPEDSGEDQPDQPRQD